MRILMGLVVASLAVPAAAHAGGGGRADQVQRQEQKRQDQPCAARERDRPREVAAKVDCKVNKPVPPVVDPTPIFLL